MEFVEFSVAGALNEGDFLINAMVPPVQIQPPFQSRYQLTVSTGTALDTNTLEVESIMFSLLSSIRATNLETETIQTDVSVVKLRKLWLISVPIIISWSVYNFVLYKKKYFAN